MFVVATPLGHLGDLTSRAADLLRATPVVAAEDTRRTRALLTHLGARPRMISYHAHSAPGVTEMILGILKEGQDVALVSDAGTPAVSDPGAALVTEVRSAGYAVVPLPGPSAVSAALSAAGMPADRYVFLGFLPRKGAERARLLQRAAREEWTCVFFEAPGRLGELLADLGAACGKERRAVVARELTKVHEEIRAGTVGELASALENAEVVRGECTVVLEGAPPAPEASRSEGARVVAGRLLDAGVSSRQTMSLVGELFGVARNDAYRLVMELRNER